MRCQSVINNNIYKTKVCNTVCATINTKKVNWPIIVRQFDGFQCINRAAILSPDKYISIENYEQRLILNQIVIHNISNRSIDTQTLKQFIILFFLALGVLCCCFFLGNCLQWLA